MGELYPNLTNLYPVFLMQLHRDRSGAGDHLVSHGNEPTTLWNQYSFSDAYEEIVYRV